MITLLRVNCDAIGNYDVNTLKEAIQQAIKSRADLSRADFSGADLNGANLSGADLNGADLSRADLSGADLIEADLSGADLSGARYSILQILKIQLYGVSDELCLELMRWDALTCGEAKMNVWSDGGKCPFASEYLREFYFEQKRSLWKAGLPTMNHRQLWDAIAQEKDIKIS